MMGWKFRHLAGGGEVSFLAGRADNLVGNLLRCPHATLATWRRLHKADTDFLPDILERVQHAVEENPCNDDDAPTVEDIVGGGGGGGPVGGEGEEVASGHPLGGGHVETSIVRYAKSPWQKDIDDSCCEFFVENVIPFKVAKSRSFKKFTLACYGPQPSASHPLRLKVCAKVITRIVNGLAWENMVWRGDVREKVFFVEETVLDKAFWDDVKKLATLMKGPYNVLREVDKDVHCLSHIYDMACQLPVFVHAALVTDEERDEILTAMANRTDMLLSPIHGVARLLDPVLRDIAVFSNVALMTQFRSVVDRLIGKRGSKRFSDYMEHLYDFQFRTGYLACVSVMM
ncbi:hypothetical protein CBR_g54956 [Chara braunii]|uniref:Uncharacterized protein n=1 Tax=Chara braunii TaxID=69332 RepID=A0A388K7H1_CHABU|nr:hypothetical protein CBR_g54956 [Chara braunii]|eukprot:GBG65977.1 hypothetical protein CBR_g54956 [Chara braunii]